MRHSPKDHLSNESPAVLVVLEVHGLILLLCALEPLEQRLLVDVSLRLKGRQNRPTPTSSSSFALCFATIEPNERGVGRMREREGSGGTTRG